jgi:hypothetical protein
MSLAARRLATPSLSLVHDLVAQRVSATKLCPRQYIVSERMMNLYLKCSSGTVCETAFQDSHEEPVAKAVLKAWA